MGVSLCGAGLLTASSVLAQANLPLGVNGVAATNGASSTKLVPLNKKDGLTAFEEELSKSLQILSPKSSLDGVLAPEYRPPPAPVVQTRRPRETHDRRNELLLMNAEEMGKSGEDWLPFLNQEEDRRSKSSLEGIYQQFNREAGGKWKGLDSPGPQGRLSPGERSETRDEESLPSGLRQAQNQLKKQLGLESRGALPDAGPVRGSLSDFFGSGEHSFSAQEVQAHKDYIQRYQQVLDGLGAPPAGSSMNPATLPEAQPAVVTYPGLEVSPLSSRPAENAASSWNRSSVVDPVRLPDPNIVTKQWDPLYEPPKVEVAKPASLFTPPVEVPRRRF